MGFLTVGVALFAVGSSVLFGSRNPWIPTSVQMVLGCLLVIAGVVVAAWPAAKDLIRRTRAPRELRERLRTEIAALQEEIEHLNKVIDHKAYEVTREGNLPGSVADAVIEFGTSLANSQLRLNQGRLAEKQSELDALERRKRWFLPWR